MSTDPLQQAFSDADAVARYVRETPRRVPGLADLHRMTQVLLAETVPTDAQLLVLGGGGGMEIQSLAGQQPSWRFTGVDPSAEMIDLAAKVVSPVRDRVTLVKGYIDDAPPGPYDGATCLLTLHFLQRDERLQTLRQLARRLKPDAPLIVAHHSVPEGVSRLQWFMRSTLFADVAGALGGDPAASAAMMAEQLPVLPVADEEAVLREAGFSRVELFYAGFSFRGWRCSAPTRELPEAGYEPPR